MRLVVELTDKRNPGLIFSPDLSRHLHLIQPFHIRSQRQIIYRLNALPGKGLINIGIEDKHIVAGLNQGIGIERDVRTVIDPGNVFDLYPITDQGEEGVKIKRKNKVGFFSLQRRRKRLLEGRIGSFIRIFEGI